MWSFHIPTKIIKKLEHEFRFGTTEPSPRGNYQVTLGKPDIDGEIRRLNVVDFIDDKQWETSPLPAHLSYMQGVSEFDGSPFGDIKWNNVDSVRAKVFLANVPYDLFDAREPVLDKNVSLYRSESSQ